MSSPIGVPILGLVSHTRKVQRLYKGALRTLECWYDRRPAYRYQAVLIRQRFEENRCIKDMREAKLLVEQAQEELFLNQHWQPRKFVESPGGPAYQREVIPPDWVLDYWHPMEKAQYPEYFALREKRKEEYIRMWEKKYGKPDPKKAHH